MKITSSVQSNTLGGCRNVYFNGISMLSVAAFFAGRGGFLTRLSLTINNDNFPMIPSAGAFCNRFDLKLRICSLFTRLKFALQALPIPSLLWKNGERKLYHFTNFTFGSASATVGTAAGLLLCAEFASGSRYRESKIVSFGGKL